MIIDYRKTIEALSKKVLETYPDEQHHIVADNLDEIALVVHEGEVLVENDHGSIYDVESLSQLELESFCSEYRIPPVYDVYETLAEFRNYLVGAIKEQFIEDGVETPYILYNDFWCRVRYISASEVCVSGRDYVKEYIPLIDLSIDGLINIYYFQN